MKEMRIKRKKEKEKKKQRNIKREIGKKREAGKRTIVCVEGERALSFFFCSSSQKSHIVDRKKLWMQCWLEDSKKKFQV